MICQNAILSDEYMDYIWKADVNPPAEMDHCRMVFVRNI